MKNKIKLLKLLKAIKNTKNLRIKFVVHFAHFLIKTSGIAKTQVTGKFIGSINNFAFPRNVLKNIIGQNFIHTWNIQTIMSGGMSTKQKLLQLIDDIEIVTK